MKCTVFDLFLTVTAYFDSIGLVRMIKNIMIGAISEKSPAMSLGNFPQFIPLHTRIAPFSPTNILQKCYISNSFYQNSN